MTPAVQTPFVPGPIASAGAVDLADSSSGQPVMAEAILDWFRPMTIGIITSVIQDASDETTDGTAVEKQIDVKTAGVIIPGSPRKLSIQQGGERSWKNSVLYTSANFRYPNDTVVVIKGERNRIMAQRDFSPNGYMKYELLEDYANPS